MCKQHSVVEMAGEGGTEGENKVGTQLAVLNISFMIAATVVAVTVLYIVFQRWRASRALVSV